MLNPADFCGGAPIARLGLGQLREYRAPAALLALTALALSSQYAAGLAVRSELQTRPVKAFADGRFPSGARAPAAQPVLTAFTQSGKGIAAALVGAGVAPGDARGADALIARTIFPDRIPAGTPLQFQLETSGPDQPSPRLASLRLRARLDLGLTIVRRGSGLQLAASQIAIDTTPLHLSGMIGPDLPASLRAANVPPAVRAQAQDALLRQLGSGPMMTPGMRFDLVIAQRRAADGRVETGDILYAALRRGAQSLGEMIRWPQDGALIAAPTPAFAGDVRGPMPRSLPVEGRLTSLFGLRFHPILGYIRLHAGLDIGARWGAPVVAMAAGRVAIAGWHGGHGIYVLVDHPNRLSTGYAHLSRIAVSPGQTVQAGQLLGFVGSTGLSTGPHLHYEVFRAGQPVDPLGADLSAGAPRAALQGGAAAVVAALRSFGAVEPDLR